MRIPLPTSTRGAVAIALIVASVACSATEPIPVPADQTTTSLKGSDPAAPGGLVTLNCEEGVADYSFDPITPMSVENLALVALNANRDLRGDYDTVESSDGSISLVWRRGDGTVWALLKADPIGTERYEFVSLAYCD